MNSTGLKSAGALVALALCACNGALPFDFAQGRPAQGDVPVAPSITTPNGRPVTAARPNPIPVPRYMTMLPDRHSNSKTFEYIINYYGTYAGIFDYPKGTQQIGQIANVGGQGCTNVLYGYGKRIFWIVAAHTRITEFEVPKRAIKSLHDSVGMPSSCAMNASGDLAVGILSGSGHGDVVIFKNASGSGTVMKTPLNDEYFDGYDDQGNLFADGYSGQNFQLVELPKGSSKFEAITTSNTVQFPGSVQWDGTYLTVFDQKANAFYQYTVSGTTATLQGTVSLTGSSDCAQTWIATGVVYCADAGNDDGEVFKYPAGGAPIATFTGSFDFPLGTVAAKK